MDYGYVRVAAATPLVKVADCKYNVDRIEFLINKACSEGVGIVAFPELSVTGYSCGDLFGQQLLLEQAQEYLGQLVARTKDLNIISIVGTPIAYGDSLLNAAVVFGGGFVYGVVPKKFLPNYREYSEKRWFASASQIKAGNICLCGQSVPISDNMLFVADDIVFGIELCEDLWAPIPQSSIQTLGGAEIMFNLSASSEYVGKNVERRRMIQQQSIRSLCGYVLASSGYGESTSSVVFAGGSFICEAGDILAESARFNYEDQLLVSEVDVDRIRNERRSDSTYSECRMVHRDVAFGLHRVEISQKVRREYAYLHRVVDSHPFIHEGPDHDLYCSDVFAIQSSGLVKRMEHTMSRTAVVGISGGLDSTLALLVCVEAFDRMKRSRKDIIGVTMPGFGTTDRTYNNALDLMRSLGVTVREISIRESCLQHFADIGHDPKNRDTTYENAQARERTQILMDIANDSQGIVVGTGDLSELALGWATYNGDHMSMYGVNAGVAKTLIRHIVKWVAETKFEGLTRTTLLDIVDTPISPELIPAEKNGEIKQKTEDLVGPYELHDFFLFNMLRYGFPPRKIFYLAKIAFASEFSDDVIRKWLKTFCRRFFAQQFKRSCLPDGPKVWSVSLSSHADWQMPSDATGRLWADECELF